MAYAFSSELSGNSSEVSDVSLTSTALSDCAIGSLVVVGVMVADDAAVPVVTDSQGNTWTQLATTAIQSHTYPFHTYLFYSVLTTALVGTVDTVTATFTAPPLGSAIVASNFTGSSAATVIDQSNSGVGYTVGGISPAAVSAGSITTTGSDLLIGVLSVTGTAAPVTWSAGSGWTLLTAQFNSFGVGPTSKGIGIVLQYRIEASAGPFTGDASYTFFGLDKDWGAIVTSFDEGSLAAVIIAASSSAVCF